MLAALVHPSHIVSYAPRDSLSCRLHATRIILCIGRKRERDMPMSTGVYWHIPFLLQTAWVLAAVTRLIHETRPLRGRRQRRSNPLQADLSFTLVT
ncbi:hypothetical protein C9426_11855 [Serratia sp. S1B]|nr:hypothetical protein C9426_11855 [Serratia sp. S1B]